MADYPVPSRSELAALWRRYDCNGNGMLSLAEIDKCISAEFPEYDDKAALMRAYKFADADGSGFVAEQRRSPANDRPGRRGPAILRRAPRPEPPGGLY
jgi:hypothetical protein